MHHFGNTYHSDDDRSGALGASPQLRVYIGSVGSERGRSLAERSARFIADKTLLLSESGNILPTQSGDYLIQKRARSPKRMELNEEKLNERLRLPHQGTKW